MKMLQKFTLSFTLAVTLHVAILAFFWVGFSNESESVEQKPLPEIIQASMLDDVKIMQEANRQKLNEENRLLAQQKQQKALENDRQKELALLLQAKDQRKKQEKEAKDLQKKNKELALLETQKLQQLKKQKALEAAKLAKIKQQKQVEKKQLDAMRKAEAKKREQDLIAKEKRKQEKAAKEKAKAKAKAALLKKQAEAAKAEKLKQAADAENAAQAVKDKFEQDRKATLSASVAIQAKVNNNWIKPITSAKGLHSTIRVKLLPSGDVMDVLVVKSSGDTIFDRSAENAVLKASPLPVPKDRALFAKKFRTFTFEFKPE